MLFNNNHFQSMKKWIGILFVGGSALLTVSLCEAKSQVDYALCDLKTLSLLIPKQTGYVTSSGQLSNVALLKKSQEQMNQAINAIHQKDSSQKEISEILEDAQMVSADIDLLIQNQKKLNDLYEFQTQVGELIPKIQDKYNFIVNRMAVEKYSAIEVLVPKSQMLFAERILRSSENMEKRNDALFDNIVDFLANLDTFNIYLQAQLEGNTELGVKRVKDEEIREILTLIQKDMSASLNAGAKHMMENRQSLVDTFIAAHDININSDKIFQTILKLDSNQKLD